VQRLQTKGGDRKRTGPGGREKQKKSSPPDKREKVERGKTNDPKGANATRGGLGVFSRLRIPPVKKGPKPGNNT